MNNDQEQDRGEFAPAPTVFNDLASLKYKTTVGPIESAMREQLDGHMTGYQSKRAMAQAIDKVNWADHEPNGLAQPEQEPQICCGEYDTCLRACTPRGRHLAQPEQELVQFEAWLAKQHGDPEEIGFLQALRIAYIAGQDSITTPPQRTEQNFCPRCGKRTNDIHTCTPPQEKNTSVWVLRWQEGRTSSAGTKWAGTKLL